MSKFLSYYRLLDVDARASSEELKKAYRKQALKFHPDTNKGDGTAAAMFLAVKNAYEALSDPDRRSEVESFVRTSGAVRAEGSLAPRPGSIPDPKPNPWENDLNYLMWDLDDLVNAPIFPRGFAHPIMDFLTYLDKWVLMPAKFTSSPARDAREGARDPRSYIDFFMYQKRTVPCEFRSVQDYFFDVKSRVMGFQSWTDPGLVNEIKGVRLMARLDAMREQLLYHLMRSQRIGFYYMFEFERVRKGLKPSVDLFVHENSRG
ncbi:MAG: DnaJ domain-containing protein [Spirochaetales bacterium]